MVPRNCHLAACGERADRVARLVRGPLCASLPDVLVCALATTLDAFYLAGADRQSLLGEPYWVALD